MTWLKSFIILILQKIVEHNFKNVIPLNIMSEPNIIEYFRKESGITQQTLANQFGVTQSAINHAIFRDFNSDLRLNVINTINEKILATQ